ncbi:MAG: amidohydrolase family protein [Rhodospirillales bacterium]|nr:amidohydrolase family protein [Rhodospirillales bacterium]
MPKHPSPSRPTAYVNARLLDPASGLDALGGLLVEGEKIAAIGKDLFRDGARWRVPEGAAEVDCRGLCLAPGLVDMRVLSGEPGEEHKETLDSLGHAAVAGGVTSLVCLPNTTPVIDDMSVAEFIARRARKVGMSKAYVYGAATKGAKGVELAEMGLLAEAGALAFTDGLNAVANARVMKNALAYASSFDLLIVQHAEEPALAQGGAMNAGARATRLGLSGIPAAAEAIMVERDIRLAEMTGARLHFAHVSTAESLAAIRRAKDRGLKITCDTAPPYFALTEADVGDYRTFAKLSPPLRSEDDRRAVVAALKDGTIDAVASDHIPEDEEVKRLPFPQAAFGGIGLETLLPITLELVHNRELAMLDALRLVTAAPAKLMRLAAGELAAGRPADFVLFDPERAWQVDADKLHSKSKNSPFDGRAVQGRAVATYVDGRAVFAAESDRR